MNTLIVGMGEIGSSLYRILASHYPTWGVDLMPELNTTVLGPVPKEVGVMHVCIRFGPSFERIVKDYVDQYKPALIDICSTVPPNTTEMIRRDACHSTTRGLHPNLEEGLKTVVKHVGGPSASVLARYFKVAGINCRTHAKARTTELLHILNNVHYGVNLLFADEAARLCREYAVDYYDYLTYTDTNNQGYEAMGMRTKVRPILTPPGGKIGGHCVTMSAGLIPAEKRPAMIDMLAKGGI